jgi:hypothetical protein
LHHLDLRTLLRKLSLGLSALVLYLLVHLEQEADADEHQGDYE